MSFDTTRWRLILKTRDSDPNAAPSALEELCQIYWQPLYAYLRKSGQDPESARDLTQGFFTQLLERHDLDKADPERGRFRSFLLTALINYSRNQWARESAQKRPARNGAISIDVSAAEGGLREMLTDHTTPEQLFERQWALALLQSAVDALREEFAHSGKSERFEALSPYLTVDVKPASYEELSDRLGISPGAVKVAVHRLKNRYGEIIRQKVADTVNDPKEVDGEIAHLLTVFDQTPKRTV